MAARPLLRLAPRPRRAPAGDEAGLRGAQEQLALCAPDHLRRLEQPLRYGFADRTSARKGLEVAAGVAIADRLGSIRQTAGPPIGRHGYMAIVWLGSWFRDELRPEAGAYLDWAIVRDLPPIARKLYGLLENDRFEALDEDEEWQAYWLGPPFFVSVGSTCARERDNVAAVARAC